MTRSVCDVQNRIPNRKGTSFLLHIYDRKQMSRGTKVSKYNSILLLIPLLLGRCRVHVPRLMLEHLASFFVMIGGRYTCQMLRINLSFFFFGWTTGLTFCESLLLWYLMQLRNSLWMLWDVWLHKKWGKERGKCNPNLFKVSSEQASSG